MTLFARWLGVTLLVAFVALLAYGLAARSPDRTIDDALDQGEAARAPGFDLEVLKGGRLGSLSGAWQRAARDGRVDLNELRGTPIVINLWASWCDPCRVEAPDLQAAWEEARPRGVLFLGLDNQDAREDALRFIERFGQDFPHVRDGTRDSLRRWGTTGIPETFFVSRTGRVVAHVIGTASADQLADGVDAALAGRPITATDGGEQRPPR